MSSMESENDFENESQNDYENDSMDDDSMNDSENDSENGSENGSDEDSEDDSEIDFENDSENDSENDFENDSENDFENGSENGSEKDSEKEFETDPEFNFGNSSDNDSAKEAIKDCMNDEVITESDASLIRSSAAEDCTDVTSTEDDSSDDDMEVLQKDNSYNVVLADMEKQFQLLRKVYIEERNLEVDLKMIQVVEDNSKEYDNQLKDLIEQNNVRMNVAEKARQYRIKNAKLFLEAEIMAAHQNHENEIQLLYDSIEENIKEKIRKLNEERDKANNELYSETHFVKKSKKDFYSDDYHNNEKRRKAMIIDGPYIIHRLREEEIREDVNFIKFHLRSLKTNYNTNSSIRQ